MACQIASISIHIYQPCLLSQPLTLNLNLLRSQTLTQNFSSGFSQCVALSITCASHARSLGPSPQPLLSAPPVLRVPQFTVDLPGVPYLCAFVRASHYAATQV